MSIEDRVINLEEFAADVRKYTQILTDIIRRHDERLDEHVETSDEAKRSIAALADAQIHTEEAQAHADTSIAALADAQIHTEEAQAHADARIAALADGQARTDRRVEEFAADVRKYTQILTDIIRRHDERLDEHVETSEEAKRSIAALADAQARTDQRVKELIDIVKEDRNERRAEK